MPRVTPACLQVTLPHAASSLLETQLSTLLINFHQTLQGLFSPFFAPLLPFFTHPHARLSSLEHMPWMSRETNTNFLKPHTLPPTLVYPPPPPPPCSIEYNLQSCPKRCAAIRRRCLRMFMAPTLVSSILEQEQQQGVADLAREWWVPAAAVAALSGCSALRTPNWDCHKVVPARGHPCFPSNIYEQSVHLKTLLGSLLDHRWRRGSSATGDCIGLQACVQ